VKRRSRLRQSVLLALVALLAIGAGILLDATSGLKGIERASQHARFDVRGTQTPRSDVVVVGIDDKTLAGPPAMSLPFNRKAHAKVIDNLVKAGAKVIAYDVEFTEQSPDEDADNALYTSVQNADRIVLATAEVDHGQTKILGGGDALKESGATPSSSVLSADADGRVRRMHFTSQGIESFAMAAARLQQGHAVATHGDSAWIDYAGPPGTIRELSFADVQRDAFPADAVRGKVVVVGRTAPSLRDTFPTPTTSGDEQMSEPEVQASQIATALDRFPLSDARGGIGVLLVTLLGAIAPLLALVVRPLIACLAGVLAGVVFLIAAQIAFNHGTVVSVVPPVGALAVGLIGTTALSSPLQGAWVDHVVARVSRGGLNQRSRRLRALMLLGAAATVIFGGLLLEATRALRNLEYQSVNARFDVRGTQPPPDDVVLVGVDDKTFNEPPRPQWPFDRKDHAKVIDNLKKAGAKVIAFDIQFTEQQQKYADEEKNIASDNALIEATRKAGNVVLATTEVDANGDSGIFGNSYVLQYSRGTPGNSNYSNDSDGRIRHMQFVINRLDTFPMVAAAKYLHKPVKALSGNDAWIDFAGPPATVRQLSYVDVRNGTFPADAVRGKVVIVGAAAPTLHDFFPTSTSHDVPMAGFEIHANAVATALAGFPIRNAPPLLNVLILIFVAGLAPLAALRLGIIPAVALGSAAIAGLLVLAQVAFNNGTMLYVVYPVIAALAGILATAAINALTVAFEREQARDAFARFVPEAVVDQVLRDADGVRLGGVRREGTVMFSDLRGFTSFSESLEPEQVIESLNMYLTEMSEAILDHGGTLVAYMGDGIMAVFGAPLQQPDHADRALEAARDMLSRMEKFNGYLRDKGLNEGGFKMGIGLNSGPVMSGNVGSERRLEYTALGDTTNTAARLEGMTKGTPHQLFVADTTREMLTRPVEDLIEVGEAEVRGRVAKVMLWSLADQPAPPPETHTPAAEPVEAGDAEHPLPPVA
jgi:adenylate cyclase